MAFDDLSLGWLWRNNPNRLHAVSGSDQLDEDTPEEESSEFIDDAPEGDLESVVFFGED